MMVGKSKKNSKKLFSREIYIKKIHRPPNKPKVIKKKSPE
jgi:hypothetical protein